MPRATLKEVADRVGGRLIRAGRLGPEGSLRGLAPLNRAGGEELSWLNSKKYRPLFAASQAGAVIVPQDFEARDNEAPQAALIAAANPELAMALAARLLVARPVHPGRVMAGAVVDPSAEIGEGATVYPLAFVGPGACVGSGAVVYPLAYVGPGVKVGPRTVIQPQAALLDGVEVGADCLISAGAVVGSEGFGFAQTPEGRHVKIPQQGTVRIGDEVELGANTAVDRATAGETRIGRGTKLDNLVQVAHNVDLGEDCVFAAQVGISGSSKVGRGTFLGGQVGLADHIEIGERTMIGAQAGVMADLQGGQAYVGTPALPFKETLRIVAAQKKLPELLKTVARLEQRLAELEKDKFERGGGQ